MEMVSSIGWRLVDIFQDPGSSSENLARPEMQRLMACVELGQFEHLVVYAVDRLTRRLFDFARLMELLDKSGVKLTVVTDPHFGESSASRLSSNIVAAASEFQQDLTKERMAETRAAMKAKGMRVAGRVPLGYSYDRVFSRMVIVPEEAELIEDFFSLAARGKTPADIADIANKRESGRSDWNARRLLQVLSNPVYAGYLPGDSENFKTLRKGNHEGIITPETFEQVRQHLVARRKRTPTKRTVKSEGFPLRGLLFCGKCGRVMTPNTSDYGNRRYRWYQCRSQAGGRPPCKGVSVRAYDMEEFVAANIAGAAICSKLKTRFSDDWKSMTLPQRAALLQEHIVRIEYNHESAEVDFQLKETSLD
jgi:site-specific DNA recombinase